VSFGVLHGPWVNRSEWRLNLRLDFCADRWSNVGGSTVWFTAWRESVWKREQSVFL
jgi:hypothetical protein